MLVFQRTLFLASQSLSRQQLLCEAKIPFVLLAQRADESTCDWGLPLEQLVASIALHKMEHVDFSEIKPDHRSGEIFVLTADTLSQDVNGVIHGKPKDRADAIAKIKAARCGVTHLSTAFCLEKRVWHNSQRNWEMVSRILKVVGAQYQFLIPDEWIETYLEVSGGLGCSNAIAVERYGAQFLKDVRGSYTAIVGLPMYEVREALQNMGFFAR